MRSTLLMAEPGAGKSTMAGLTAERPVHFVDVDRKILSMENLRPLVESGEITVDEVDEPLIEERLDLRAQEFGAGRKPAIQPKGWIKFANIVSNFEKDERVAKAKTICLDSVTRLGWHLQRLVIYQDPRGISTLSDRNWGSYLHMFNETVSLLIDFCRSTNKDFVANVHEKTTDVPTDSTRVERIVKKGGDIQREFVGMMDVRIYPSIEGQFGGIIASLFDEVYHLRVEVDDRTKMPTWTCRVLPDGRRPLRTSFNVKQPEFPPDFREIWRDHGK